MNCWLCFIEVKNYVLLPEQNDNFQIPKQKTTYIIRNIDKYIFLQYYICYDCMEKYLKNYPFSFKKIRDREIGKKL